MNIVQPDHAAGVAAADGSLRDYNFAADILKRNLDAGRAGKLAYIDQRQGWTYGELAERVERFGHVLRSLGIRREERILLCLLDTIDWPTAFLGAIKAGVVPVPVNTLLTEDEYRFMVEDSRARLLGCFRGALSEIRQAHREPKRIGPRHRVGREDVRSRAVRGPAFPAPPPTR